MGKSKMLFKLIFFVLLFHFSTNGLAQQKKNKISALEDQLKAVNVLKNTKPDSAFLVVSNLINSAHLTKLPLQEAKGLLIKGAILYNRDENKQAFTLFNQALTLFQRANDKLGMAKAYNNLGGASAALNDPEKALYYQQQALQIRTLINDPLLSSTYNMIGNIYLEQGNYPKAIANYLKGLPISEKNNDKYVQSSLLNNIAQVYWKQNRYEEAFKYTAKCLDLEKQENDYKGMAGSYNNLAGIRIDQGNFEEAFNFGKEAVKYAEKVNFTKELARAYSVMGEIAYRKGNYTDAINYSSTALAQRRKIGRDRETVMSLIKLSEAYTALKEYNKAELLCLEGIQLCNKNNLLSQKRSLYQILGDIYSKKGDWKNAYLNDVEHNNIKDSLFNESNSKLIFDLQTKYETEKKEAQITLLNKENKVKSLQLLNNGLEIEHNENVINQQQQELTISLLEIRNKNQLVKNQKIDAERKNENIKNLQKQAQIQQLKLAKRNTLIITISFITLLGALISYLLYNRYKIKQKALLEVEIFRQQEIAAQSLFDGEQKERVRIARDLHDSIGQMLSVVKMNISSMDDIEVENSLSNNTASLVDKTIEEVRHISHNLIPEELNFGLFNALESLCEKINNSKKTQATLRVPDSIKHYVFEKQNELSIYRIVQEVLNNMVKHAEANHININILQNEKQLLIQIKDDGKGFNTKNINEGKGLGWKNIQARVKMLNGKLEITSEKLTGTEIEISIPEWNKQITT